MLPWGAIPGSTLVPIKLGVNHFRLLFGEQRAAVNGAVAQHLFDPQQLVVFGHPVTARGRTGLDLARVKSDGQIGDRGIFRFAAAMAGNTAVAIAMSQLDRLNRFGQRADLIDFDQNAVGDAFVDTALKSRRVGDEQVVADQLNAIATDDRSTFSSRPNRLRCNHLRSNRSDIGRPNRPGNRPWHRNQVLCRRFCKRLWLRHRIRLPRRRVRFELARQAR